MCKHQVLLDETFKNLKKVKFYYFSFIYQSLKNSTDRILNISKDRVLKIYSKHAQILRKLWHTKTLYNGVSKKDILLFNVHNVISK